MLIQIEPNSDLPIYTQLVNQLIEAIARGDLKSEETLPSVRSLAADLSMNMHTVNKAYHALEQKGIIQIIPKSGAVINSSSSKILPADFARLEETFRPLVAEALVLGMDKSEINELVSSIISDLKGGS